MPGQRAVPCYEVRVPRLSAQERRLEERLDALLARVDLAGHRAEDPVSFVHAQTTDDDREVVGLLASSLAFGNVVAIGASITRALTALGPSPARAVEEAREAELARRLRGFVHRVYRGAHVARLLARAGEVRRREGSLGLALARRLEAGMTFRDALADWADELRGEAPERGLAHLVPDPRAGSACKRMLLYARWMVRPADGVDLGLWPVSPSRLVIPVDTHIHRIARNLGLTERRDASWRTAEEITAALRRFDPDDPVKYDFALCHLGVSRQCPSRRQDALCEPCVLRPVCRHWMPRAGLVARAAGQRSR
jgi:uncharacterized protein (TIGR02757 family)